MLTLVKDAANVTRFIRNLRGGSQPILAEASDGFLYVVKFANNLQGPNLAFNESAGAELYRSFNLPVPEWRPLKATDSFIDQNPDCWIQTPTGTLRPLSGLCFGSRFLGREGVRLLEILPGNSFKRVRNLQDFWLAWLVDICAGHTDNRQALFEEDTSGYLNAVFIDHGHMFSGPNGNEQRHFRASAYLDSRVYQGVTTQFLRQLRRITDRLNIETLWREIGNLPDEWKTASALESFARCLEMFSNAQIVQSIVDTIEDSQRPTDQRESIGFQDEQPQLRWSVLCPELPPTKPGRIAVA